MKLFLLRKFLLFFTVICAFFTACDSGSDSGGDKTVYAKEIVSFSFLQSNNDNLTKDIAGCVSDSKITVFVQGGTDLTALAPSISIQGSSVSPASGEAQLPILSRLRKSQLQNGPS